MPAGFNITSVHSRKHKIQVNAMAVCYMSSLEFSLVYFLKSKSFVNSSVLTINKIEHLQRTLWVSHHTGVDTLWLRTSALNDDAWLILHIVHSALKEMMKGVLVAPYFFPSNWEKAEKRNRAEQHIPWGSRSLKLTVRFPATLVILGALNDKPRVFGSEVI